MIAIINMTCNYMTTITNMIKMIAIINMIFNNILQRVLQQYNDHQHG